MMLWLLLLGLLGLAFAGLRWRRLQWTCWVLGVAIYLLAGCGVLPMLLLKSLQAPYVQRPTIHWAQRSAIVVLGGGLSRLPDGQIEPLIAADARLVEGVSLYRACRQGGNDCKLLMSGGDPWHYGTPEAVAYGRELEAMGVAHEDLILEPRSLNTWQNAQFSQPLLHDVDPQQVLLVSSAWHLNRALRYFQHFGIDATPVRADYLDVRLVWWPNAWNMALTEQAWHEYVGEMTYRLYQFMGWNAPPPSFKGKV